MFIIFTLPKLNLQEHFYLHIRTMIPFPLRHQHRTGISNSFCLDDPFAFGVASSKVALFCWDEMHSTQPNGITFEVGFGFAGWFVIVLNAVSIRTMKL